MDVINIDMSTNFLNEVYGCKLVDLESLDQKIDSKFENR